MEPSKHSRSASRWTWLAYAGLFVILALVFVISCCGFFREDDLMMHHEASSWSELFRQTRMFYMTRGGRWLSIAGQYLFAGVCGGQKLWFDITNTLFFLLFLFVGAALIRPGRENRIQTAFVLALFFWFLCPDPKESVFWVAGSVTYLWAISLTYLFLVLYFKYKEEQFSVSGKIGLFFLSIVCASEFISAVSICGAFVVYYAFHLKAFKRNAVPMVCGFVVGTLIVLLAPGNFARVGWEGQSFLSKVNDLARHPLLEITKYKAFWLFLAVFVWGWIKDKSRVKAWTKDHAVLLYSLGWSILAFSVVFRPLNRALFFPETLSLILFLKFLYENHSVFKIRFIDALFAQDASRTRRVCAACLFVLLSLDAVFAIAETNRLRIADDRALDRIAESGGIVAVDRTLSSHRMAYVEHFPEWTWEPLADRFALDSVHVYPYFCLDQYYGQEPPLENVYVEYVRENDDTFGRQVRFIVRVKAEEVQESEGAINVNVDYTRPRKWYKAWLDRLRKYNYERSFAVKELKPYVRFDGYCFYEMWIKRENAKNLKRVEVSIPSRPGDSV